MQPQDLVSLAMNHSTPSGTRRMHSLQRSAGRYFYQWAVQIGEQLSRFIEQTEVKDKQLLKMEDTMEDFFDDLNDRERRISLSTAEEDSPRGSKDTIEEVVIDKKGILASKVSTSIKL
ncbi:unnamed protein product [Strongylus vulgaris]|uniref:Protein UNC80 central region domain-containing protein n=1 Tax=Strongylus vulgaris TaxID=40348 RepID=A0A3P7JE89_STRVU|nr:unnamed protein product [Strongylus vulgaris]